MKRINNNNNNNNNNKGNLIKHKALGEWMISPRILGLGISWRWVAIFTLRPLYSRGKSSQHPFNRRLIGHQNQSGRENSSLYRDSNSDTSAVHPVTRCYTDWITLTQCDRSGGIGPAFLTSILEGGEWSASRPGCFTAGKVTSEVLPTCKYLQNIPCEQPARGNVHPEERFV
jgi:hypothetical protein